MRTTTFLLAGALIGLALVGLPFDEVSVAGTAAAVYCEPEDLNCHENQIERCVLPYVYDPTDPPVCPM